MNPDEKQVGCDNAGLVSKFKEDLRVSRETLLEAKQRVVMLEQRLRIFLICLLLLLTITLFYGTIQIWQTSTWLHDYGYYVRQERDPRWEKWMDEIRRNQDIIKSCIDKMRTH